MNAALRRLRNDDVRAVTVAAVAAIAAVTAIGIWLISPRFALTTLSLVDDWWSARTSADAFSSLVQLSYDPVAVGDPARYRPAWAGLWNAAVFHTFGAPTDLTVANVWNASRVAAFVAVMIAVPTALIPRLSTVAVSACATLAVLTTPEIPTQFARLGTQEPLLVTGMVGGFSLIVFGVTRAIERKAGASTVWPFVAGTGLWIFGVYHKEASIVALGVMPLLYVFVERRLRDRNALERPLRTYRPFQIAAVVLLAPLVHMLVKVASVGAGGVSSYGTETPRSVEDIAEKLATGSALQILAMPHALGTRVWLVFLFGLAAVVVALRLMRRSQPLVLALVAASWGALAFHGLAGGGEPARYYIAVFPIAVLGGVVLAAQRQSIALIGAASAAALAIIWLPSAHARVEAWAAAEREAAGGVERVARLDPAGCRVLAIGLDPERAEALPVVVGRRESDGTSSICRPASAWMIVGGQPFTAADRVALGACASPWIVRYMTRLFTIEECRAWNPTRVDSGALAGLRLVPGVPQSEVRAAATRTTAAVAAP